MRTAREKERRMNSFRHRPDGRLPFAHLVACFAAVCFVVAFMHEPLDRKYKVKNIPPKEIESCALARSVNRHREYSHRRNN